MIVTSTFYLKFNTSYHT